MSNISAHDNESQLQDSSPLLRYIETEARKLSILTLYEIDHYIDREVLNREMQNYLNSVYAEKNYFHLPASLTLSFYENILLAGHPLVLTNWFADAREKIKRQICLVMSDTTDPVSHNWNASIKTILDNINPILGNGHEISAIVTPIIIGYVAKLIKYGYDEVCVV